MGNGKYLSIDGAWYSTFDEKLAADARYKQQERQNELIEQQTRKIEQQNRLIEQQNQLNYQLEQEKIQKNYELEMNKLQHEEKMRILRLFDDVGISKETYDAYINSKFTNETTNELLKQKDEHLLMNSKYDFLLHEDEKIKELGYSTVNKTMDKYDMYGLKNSVRSDCYDKVSKADQKAKDDLIVKSKYAKRWLIGSLISVPLSLILFIAVCEGPEPIVYTMIALMACICTALIVSGCVWNQIENEIKEIPDKTFNVNKYHNKLNMLITQENETVNKLIETIKKDNEEQVDALYNFRLNHYNASIEKLLIDVGFKELVESLGLEYKKVNNSNKKKDGTIEEYIEYFETNS